MRVYSLAFVLFSVTASMALSEESAGCSLRDATTPDGSTVYLLCENGAVLRSGDAGAWETIRIPADGHLRAIQFVDANRGFVAGDSGTLLSTQDGGKNWNRIDTGEREHFTDVRARGTHVWVAGYEGTIVHSADGWWGLLLRTGDGGKTWRQINVPGVRETLSSVYFRDAQNGWASGMYGVVLRSRDGGVKWKRQQTPGKAWLRSLAFGRDGAGWIAAEYDLLRSDDGGESWHTVPLETSMAVTRVLATSNALLAVTPGFLLMRPRNESAWLRLDADQMMTGAVRATSQSSAAKNRS